MVGHLITPALLHNHLCHFATITESQLPTAAAEQTTITILQGEEREGKEKELAVVITITNQSFISHFIIIQIRRRLRRGCGKYDRRRGEERKKE